MTNREYAYTFSDLSIWHCLEIDWYASFLFVPPYFGWTSTCLTFEENLTTQDKLWVSIINHLQILTLAKLKLPSREWHRNFGIYAKPLVQRKFLMRVYKFFTLVIKNLLSSNFYIKFDLDAKPFYVVFLSN